MVELTREETETAVRLMKFIIGEGIELREDETMLLGKLYLALHPPVPDSPKDPRAEDDEYEPPLGLSQDV